jgi:predicted phage terminase large subunit-like protein
MPGLPPLEAVRAERARRAIEKKAQEQIEVEAKRLADGGLIKFVRDAWPVLFGEVPFDYGWHLGFMAEHLEAITHGTFIEKGLENRLLINVPPGTMKSLLVSVFWPAYEWGPCGMSRTQVIATSFNIEFCVRDSLRFRQLVMSDWFQQRWPMRMRKVSEGKVENEYAGFRQAVPFGSLTGGRCDRLILDDPHSVDSAESDLDRQRATLRFRESASLRLNNPKTSAIVVVMQRLHQHDISGVIVALQLPYQHVRLPMRYEAQADDTGEEIRLGPCKTAIGKDPRTVDGELLFPERFPVEVVDRDEKVLGAVATAGQFQQRPTPRGGLLFKRHWFKIVPVLPSGCQEVRGWDFAASKEKTSPWTVGLKLAFHQATKHIYITHVERDRVENPEPMVLRVASQDGPLVEIDIPQDPGAAGKVQSRAIIASLLGYTARCSPESGDKIQRANPIATQAEAGNVSVLAGPWNQAFLDEIETAPNGYMDQIDAMSRAFRKFVLMATTLAKAHADVIPGRPSLGDYIVGGEHTNPALGDGRGTNGSLGGLEHLGIRPR